MQYPVPQFTDVEDKIIGPLSIRQFGIIFTGGILVLLPYMATKSMPVLVIFGIIFGLPALVLAFGKINGRPMYMALGYFIKFLKSPKVLVFHKETISTSVKVDTKKDKEKNLAKADTKPLATDPKARLREVQKILAQKSEEEAELVHKINK